MPSAGGPDGFVNWNWKLVVNPFCTGCRSVEPDPGDLVACIRREPQHGGALLHPCLQMLGYCRSVSGSLGPNVKFGVKFGERRDNAALCAHAVVLPATSNNPVITATTKNLDVPTFIPSPFELLAGFPASFNFELRANSDSQRTWSAQPSMIPGTPDALFATRARWQTTIIG